MHVHRLMGRITQDHNNIETQFLSHILSVMNVSKPCSSHLLPLLAYFSVLHGSFTGAIMLFPKILLLIIITVFLILFLFGLF